MLARKKLNVKFHEIFHNKPRFRRKSLEKVDSGMTNVEDPPGRDQIQMTKAGMTNYQIRLPTFPIRLLVVFFRFLVLILD